MFKEKIFWAQSPAFSPSKPDEHQDEKYWTLKKLSQNFCWCFGKWLYGKFLTQTFIISLKLATFLFDSSQQQQNKVIKLKRNGISGNLFESDGQKFFFKNSQTIMGIWREKSSDIDWFFFQIWRNEQRIEALLPDWEKKFEKAWMRFSFEDLRCVWKTWHSQKKNTLENHLRVSLALFNVGAWTG